MRATTHTGRGPRHDTRVTAVILAAGAGARLGELGRRYSKPMVPVAGRPLIAWIIGMLEQAGCAELVVVAHPADRALAAFLRSHHPDTRLVLQRERRGIADALRQALPLLAGRCAYLACACDSVFAAADVTRLIAVGQQHPGAAVVAVLDMGAAATVSRSAVRLEGDAVVRIVEKPPPGTAPSGLVAVPLYWLPQDFGAHLAPPAPSSGEGYVSTALNAFLQAGGQVRAVRIRERIEVTRAADVRRAAARLRRVATAAVEPQSEV
jgi:NDP-sugar pyrophosphorylase family protein